MPSTTPSTLEAPSPAAPLPTSGRARRTPPTARRGRTRAPVRHLLVVTHRWISLVLGLLLLLVTTSGAVLLYAPEIERAAAPAVWQGSGGPVTVTMQQARDAVLAAHPQASADVVTLVHGVYRVADGERAWTVDPTTGAILGEAPARPAWLGVVDNLHVCLLSCEDLPGHLTPLSTQIPHTSALGWNGEDMTVGSFLLAGMALALVYLCLSGLWLWFPRPGRWRGALTVRWSKGRFARDLDLHKVVGVVALVPLLAWGVTGAGFEMEWTRKAWLAASPGTEIPRAKASSAPGGGPDVPLDAAVDAARALHPGRDALRVRLPDEKPTSAYTVFLDTGIGPAGGDLPGSVRVAVDRRTGEATTIRGQAGRPLAQRLWDDWNYPVHSGCVVGGWWRLVWLAGALSPLVLAATGLSTWLVRRRSARRRRAAAQRRAAVAASRGRTPGRLAGVG